MGWAIKLDMQHRGLRLISERKNYQIQLLESLILSQMGLGIKLDKDKDLLEHERCAILFVACLRLTVELGKGFINESESISENGMQ
jgi:hypothetical protein